VSTTGTGIGPNVICQGSFVQAPADDDQAFVTASGQFSYPECEHRHRLQPCPFDTLVPGQTYHIQGWTVLPNTDGTRFTNDGTGHGMFVSVENVAPF
jgi:hypothetical protein